MSKALVLGSMLGGPVESVQQAVVFSNTLFGVGLGTGVVGVRGWRSVR